MNITEKIEKFFVLDTESIRSALNKISINNQKIIFVINEYGQLVGSFSDGDFRRWIADKKNIELDNSVNEAINIKPTFAYQNTSSKEILNLFTEDIDLIPLLDSSDRLVAIAQQKENAIIIGDHLISNQFPAFIIAEIGNNHNGNYNLAKRLVDLAVDAGADCVKFQARDLKSLYKSSGKQDISADLGSQYTIDLLSKFQLENKDLLKIFNYCEKKNVIPLCTPWDQISLDLLESYGMQAYKVASADLTNLPLLKAIIDTKKPIICSTGMSAESEIKIAVELFKKHGANFVLLHCNSTYPAPLKDINLKYMVKLKEICGGMVGYSGHEEGYVIPIAAVALGACIIEKHFTVDKNMEGNDHKVSLMPEEFKSMVQSIRQLELAMGSDQMRKISQGEMINRENLAKSLIINTNLRKGEKITREMIEVKSPGQGIQPLHLNELIGKIANRDFIKYDFFYQSDLDDNKIEAKDYFFSRPFGIPIRFHDFDKLKKLSNLDFVEFHLSYNDMELKLSKFFKEKQELNYIVHAPELFKGDHLLNLGSQVFTYRERSINELNKVCDVTRELNKYFNKTVKPLIVCNVGGFSLGGFSEKKEKDIMYELVAESLSKIDQTNVEIIIQTMPPFPWHFGGRSFHNLFVNMNEINEFSNKFGYRICLDISHSMMASNYYKWNIINFIECIKSHVAHIHISDAEGFDGEGVKIGQGDVIFAELCKFLNKNLPQTPFIPEIWQGHKNNAEGFWTALNYLENYFNIKPT
jgi:N-acetylneuraminate synthase